MCCKGISHVTINIFSTFLKQVKIERSAFVTRKTVLGIEIAFEFQRSPLKFGKGSDIWNLCSGKIAFANSIDRRQRASYLKCNGKL